MQSTCPELLTGSASPKSQTSNLAITSLTCYHYNTKPHTLYVTTNKSEKNKSKDITDGGVLLLTLHFANCRGIRCFLPGIFSTSPTPLVIIFILVITVIRQDVKTPLIRLHDRKTSATFPKLPGKILRRFPILDPPWFATLSWWWGLVLR